jgi:dienelactone hydrolase
MLLCLALIAPSAGCTGTDSEAATDAIDGSADDTHNDDTRIDDTHNEPGTTDRELAERAVDPVPRGVVWTSTVPEPAACASPANCIDDYLRLVDRAAAFARPTDLSMLPAFLAETDAGRVPQLAPPLADDALRDRIIEELNLGFLLDGIEARSLEVAVVSEQPREGYLERTLRITDPWVGRFDALLLLPTTPGPHPGLVAAHGHGDTKERYRDEYHGAEHAPRGYVTLIPDLRAMGSGGEALLEVRVARELMQRGFSLMGLRVYELLLSARVLRSLDETAGQPLVLIGHSGGSSTGNLLVRIDRGFAAFVSDHSVDYAEWVPGLNTYHCETVPGLFEVSAQINDRATSPVPTRVEPYKYTDGMEGIFAFFDGIASRR